VENNLPWWRATLGQLYGLGCEVQINKWINSFQPNWYPGQVVLINISTGSILLLISRNGHWFSCSVYLCPSHGLHHWALQDLWNHPPMPCSPRMDMAWAGWDYYHPCTFLHPQLSGFHSSIDWMTFIFSPTLPLFTYNSRTSHREPWLSIHV
jgi:hypothetical protein